MYRLTIGDMVHVGGNRYEPVYSFGHYHTARRGTYLEVETTLSTLLLSGDHLVYCKTRGFIPASSLQRGSRLVHGSTGSDDIIVTAIRTVEAQGVFAPFTPSGMIVVNHIVASSFVSLAAPQQLGIWGVHFSNQWLAHTFEFPHRVACYYLTRCPNEAYAANGISTWVAEPLKVGRWVLVQHGFLRTTLLILFVTILGFFHIAERCLQYPGTSLVLAVIVLYSLRLHPIFRLNKNF